jgi:SAM-dependent methyltransferase
MIIGWFFSIQSKFLREVLPKTPNLDVDTVKGFGQEWSTFTQENLADSERAELFHKFFSLIDWSKNFNKVLDMGCGSGRWDVVAAPLVGELVAADASREALQVAMRNVTASNVSFVEATPESLPFPDEHFDLIFSLGVLHHIPDTQEAIRSLAVKLCPGGTLLLYIYYAFENRPGWFRVIWKMSDLGRRVISRFPFFLRYAASQFIAAIVYWPLARAAKYLPVPASWPLKFYAERSFYFMRTDALDRFGTKLEKRFTQRQIREMLEAAGLTDVRFSGSMPYWVCKATKPLPSRDGP